MGYRVRVVNVATGAETVLSPSDTRITVENLDCCADHTFSVQAATIDFGTQSPDYSFRTLADLSGMRMADIFTVVLFFHGKVHMKP